MSEAIFAKSYAEKDMTALRQELHRALGGAYCMKVPQLEAALKAFQSVVKAEPEDLKACEKKYHELQTAIDNFFAVYEKGEL